jgi:ribosomal protein S18 acetylase RimI-like enzyme
LSRLPNLVPMTIDVRAVEPGEVERLVDVALRAWEPVHASMATVLGEPLNRRVYPDWAKSQAADVRAACADPDMHVFVAVDGQVLHGFVSLVIDASERSGEIDMIAVDPAVQRRGIAGALTDHAMRVMRDAGCTLVHVATGGDPGHAAARALYEAVGFRALPLVRYYREL